MTPQYLGNKDLLNRKLTAFLASHTVQTARCYISLPKENSQSKVTAHARNKYICEIADKILFVGVNEKSSLFELATQYRNKSEEAPIVL